MQANWLSISFRGLGIHAIQNTCIIQVLYCNTWPKTELETGRFSKKTLRYPVVFGKKPNPRKVKVWVSRRIDNINHMYTYIYFKRVTAETNISIHGVVQRTTNLVSDIKARLFVDLLGKCWFQVNFPEVQKKNNIHSVIKIKNRAR